MKLQTLRLELDFLWSVKLGASLRIYSFNQDYVYTWVIWSRCMQYYDDAGKINKSPCPAECECSANIDTRHTHRALIKCAPGQLVLGNPKTEGRSQFWVLNQADVQQQIDEGKLIINSIPLHWEKMKHMANDRSVILEPMKLQEKYKQLINQ